MLNHGFTLWMLSPEIALSIDTIVKKKEIICIYYTIKI